MNATSRRTAGNRSADFSEDVQDWENHLILRVPEDVAGRINNILDSNGQVEDLAINLTSMDMRQGTVRLGQHLMGAKIYDLPCVVEVQKTIDRRNIFKVADLTQVMVCSHDLTQQSTSSNEGNVETAPKSFKKEQKQWQYPHGLTPPMKSVRRRRFRKTKKKKYMDAPEVEKELKRLLRADLDADSVKWEIVSVEDKKKETQVVSDQALFGDKVTSSEDEHDEDAEPSQVNEEEKEE